MIIIKILCFLPALFFASGAYAIEQVKFDINGLNVGDKLTGEFSSQYCPERTKGKKEIECRRKLTIDGVRVSALYFFLDSSLVTISLSYKSEQYNDLVKAYSKKFSKSPDKRSEESIVLSTGKKYTNKKVLWDTVSGNFIIEKYGNNFIRGYAHLDSHEYIKYMAEKKSALSWAD